MNPYPRITPLYLHAVGCGSVVDYLREAEANQWKSQDELKNIQWQKLKPLLEHCAANVPYYERLFKEHAIQPADIRSSDDVARIPTLTKQTIREQGDDMFRRGSDKAQLTRRFTSGSTGQPLELYLGPDKRFRSWAYNLRHNRWAGYDWGVRLASNWTVYPPDTGLLAPWREFKRRLGGKANKIELDPRRSTEEDRLAFLNRFKEFRPEILTGFANSLYALALLAERESMDLPPLKGIISGAEILTPKMRATLESVFGGRVFNRYGSIELEIIASECECGSMHTNDDHLLIELVDDPDTGFSRVVITDLHNYALPMVRYEMNDHAAWSDAACACGRGLAILAHVDGRVTDLYRTAGGRWVSGIPVAFLLEQFKTIQKFQLIQKEPNAFHMLCVVDPTFREEDFRPFETAFKELFVPEAITLTYETVDDTPRTAAGKYQSYISEIA